MPAYAIKCNSSFGHSCDDYLVTRNIKVSQRHTFAITAGIKLFVITAVDKPELSDTIRFWGIALNAFLATATRGLREPPESSQTELESMSMSPLPFG